MSSRRRQASPGPSWAVLSEPTPSSSPSALMLSDRDVDMGDDENEEAEIESVLAAPLSKRKADESPSNRAHKVPRHHLRGHASASQPVNLGASSSSSVSASSGGGVGFSRAHPISTNRPPAGTGDLFRSSSSSTQPRQPSSTQPAGASSSRLPLSRPVGTRPRPRSASGSSSSLDLGATLSQTIMKLDAKAKEKEKEKIVPPTIVARKRANNRPRVSNTTLLQQAQKANIDESSARTRIRPKRPARMTLDPFAARSRPLDTARKRRVSEGVGGTRRESVLELTDSDSARRRMSSLVASKDDPIVISSSSEDAPVSTNHITSSSTRPRPSVSSQRNAPAPPQRKRYRAPSSASKSKQRVPPPENADVIVISDSDDGAAPTSAPVQVPTSSIPPRSLDAAVTTAASPPKSPTQPAPQAPSDEQSFERKLEDGSIPEPEGFDGGEFDFGTVDVGMDENRDRLSPSLTSNLLSPRPPPPFTNVIPSAQQQATGPMNEEEENMFDSYINMDQGTEVGITTDSQGEANEGPLSTLGGRKSISPAPEEARIISSTPEEGEIVSTDVGIGVESRSMSVPEDGQVVPTSEGDACPDKDDADAEMGNGLGDKQVDLDPNDMPSTPESGEIVGERSNDEPQAASRPSPTPSQRRAIVSAPRSSSTAQLGTTHILPDPSISTPPHIQCNVPAPSSSVPKPVSIFPSDTDPSTSPFRSSHPTVPMPTLSSSSALAIPDISALKVRFKRPSTENGENAFFSRALATRKPSRLSVGGEVPVSSEKMMLAGNEVGKSNGDVDVSIKDGEKSMDSRPGACPPASIISGCRTEEHTSPDIEMRSPPLEEPQVPRSETPVVPTTPPSKVEPLKDIPTQGPTQTQAATSIAATLATSPVSSSRPSIAPPRVPPPLVSPKMTLAEAINFVRREHLAKSSSQSHEARKEKRKASKALGVNRTNSVDSTRQSTPSDTLPESTSIQAKTPSLNNLRSLLAKHNTQPRSSTSDSHSSGSASRATSGRPSTTISKNMAKSPTTQRRPQPETNTAKFESFISPVRTRANTKQIEGERVVSGNSSGNGMSQSQRSRSPQNRRKSAVASFEMFIVKVPPASPVSPAESRSIKGRTVAPPPRSSSNDSDKLLELASVHLGSEKASDGVPGRRLPPEVSSSSEAKNEGIGNPPTLVQVERPDVLTEMDGTSQKMPPALPKHNVRENSEVVSESEMSWDANLDQPDPNSSLPDPERQSSEDLIDSGASRGPEELAATVMDSIQTVSSDRSSAPGHRWRQADSEAGSNEQELVVIPASPVAAGSDEAEINYSIIAPGPASSRTASSGSQSRSRSSAGAISPKPLDVEKTKKRPAFDFGAQEFIGGYPVVTWQSYAAAQRLLPPKYYLAKNLPHSLQDRMNALPIEYRNSDFARTVLEAVIQEAMDDEPDAPDIGIYHNNIGEETTPPWEFVYTNHMWFGEGVPPPDIKNLKSCGCVGRCDPRSKTCACAKRQYSWAKPYIENDIFPSSWPGASFVYDNKGLLQLFDCPIFECNQFCGCDDDCPNRIIQNGRKWPVNIVRTERKGWGVFAGAKKIPKGAYLGIYAGELLTDPEGEERGKHYNAFGRTYLFTIDFHYLKLDMENPDLYENLYVVDAYHAGNFTRFLNHSCDPNCQIFASYINEADINKPLLTFFTIRDVEPWEELCFSYWGDIESKREEIEEAKANGEESATDAVYATCQCGSSNCIGRLF